MTVGELIEQLQALGPDAAERPVGIGRLDDGEIVGIDIDFCDSGGDPLVLLLLDK
jgi:hypothetical protein